ncbi:hypothetical protein WJX74_005022 [Apatococcus lobatus]|uniref:Protein kinase domain-containing protein n=1 Tax=Apatococcus lobatus TaxID=904363 RepID=A0AAW1RR35_9CHLO
MSDLLFRASGFSVQSDATWFTAQSQLGYDQANGIFGRQTGVTLFPVDYAVTSPGGCTHINGTVNGATALSYSDHIANLTEYVARIRTPSGGYVWGKAGSDNCGSCNNTCPCPNGTSWGFFPYDGAWPAGPSIYPRDNEMSAASFYKLTSDISDTTNTFDILLQAAPDAGFAYDWQNFSSVINSTGPVPYTAVSLGDRAPCCVPIAPVAQQILTDNTVIDPNEPNQPSTWRPAGATPTGSLMGSCSLTTGDASFTWYKRQYNISAAQGSGQAQILVISNTSSTPAPAPPSSSLQTPSVSLSIKAPPLQLQNILFSMQENITRGVTAPGQVGTTTGAQTWRPAQFPGGCSSSILPGTVTSLPGFPISNNTPAVTASNSSNIPTPAWYLPTTATSPAQRDWFVAILQTNQTTGRPYPSSSAWGLGRAWVDPRTQLWQTMFGKAGAEWNATHLVSPQAANASILGYQEPLLDRQGYRYDDHHTFTYGSAAWQAQLGKDTSFVDLFGTVPCCINAVVPAAAGGQSAIGNVLGSCYAHASPYPQANITWLGVLYQQDIAQAQLLTMTVKLRPDPNLTAKIVGGVLGGVLPLLLAAALVALALYSRRTYHARAQKRLIQDQVYNLVMGVRQIEPFSDDPMKPDLEAQGSINIDRFYNLLPFVNRMPRNQFYARLSSQVAGRCMDSARKASKVAPGQMNIVHPEFDGYKSQALAFCIMRQETCWANTDKAIVQEWQAGPQGRRRLVAAAEESVQSPELRDFLEGMDPTNEQPEPMSSKGLLRTMARTFFFTVPSYRVRHTDAQPADAPAGRYDPDAASSTNVLTSLTSQQFHGGSSTSFKDKPTQPAGLSNALRMMQLDDYEIKPSEIEIMTNLDGSPSTLGRGAFGEVFKARYNSVQIVAVKQLREGGDERAKLDFLREVAIMKKLRAENIVRFLGVCVKESKTMLVTEFMAGGDLFNRLSEADKGGELSWHQLGRRIAVDIARGLAFLHSQQIVHFDLKSPNILLARDHTAKIADVGLARFMNSDHVTQMSVMGTLAWAAPEIMRGTKDSISTKVDIYSFGVVLWEIVTSTSPRFGHEWFRPPRVPEECPAWVAELITACMSEDPSARPTSKDIYRMLLADENA